MSEQAFRIAADILGKLSAMRELTQEFFGLDDAAGSFVGKGQCSYLLLQSTRELVLISPHKH